MRRFRSTLVVPVIAALLGVAVVWEAAASAQPSASPADEASEAAREAAAVHFRKGEELLRKDALAAALAEYLESRRLFATRAATGRAAWCLRKLQRFDEALDTAELLLKEFEARMPPDVKAAAQKQVLDMRTVTGTLAIAGAEPGATLVIDGRYRGEHPSIAPLHVIAGTHVVRVYKQGFTPFEGSADVAAGQTVPVAVRLEPLTRSGRLRITERSGKALQVLLDGFAVGTTPWEGPVAVGDHTVVLRGDDSFGTLPARVTVALDKSAELSLAAEDLAASIKIVPVPAGASVAVDGLFVGSGIFEGRLRAGEHAFKIVADGYFPETRKMSVTAGARDLLTVRLRRDPDAPVWRRPGKFGLELVGSVPLSPSLGGDVAGGCMGACSGGVAFGGQVVVHGGYEIWNGFGFGVSVGYLSVRQEITGRAETLTPVGLPDDHGSADDTLKLRGFRAGGWASLRLGAERFPLRLRLGAGGLFGSVSDTRSGTFRAGGSAQPCPAGTRDDRCFSIGPVIQAPSASFFYVDPEVRVGLRISGRLELSAGVEALVLVGLSSPTWDKTLELYGANDGVATFRGDALAGSLVLLITPGVGARYEF